MSEIILEGKGVEIEGFTLFEDVGVAAAEMCAAPHSCLYVQRMESKLGGTCSICGRVQCYCGIKV